MAPPSRSPGPEALDAGWFDARRAARAVADAQHAAQMQRLVALQADPAAPARVRLTPGPVPGRG